MKRNRRYFLSSPLLGLAAACSCTRPQPARPPGNSAPALDTSNEREISYLIEREDEGKAVPVSEDFQFKSGDRFRLRFRPGFAAHVYVANRGKGDASYRLLFPLAEDRGRNPLPAGTAVALPSDSKDWMRFDESAGNEYLVLIASTVPLPELGGDEQVPREKFESDLADIERQYRPDSSRRFKDGDWIKFFAGREGALALVVRLALQHQ